MNQQRLSRPSYPWRTALVGSAVILVLPLIFLLGDSISDGGTKWALVQLVVVNPLIFVVGTLRSWFRYGWKMVFTLTVYSAAFLISVYTIYNSSALIYLLAYIVLVATCLSVVIIISSIRKNKKHP